MKYLTVCDSGSQVLICSKHITYYGAEKAAIKCEKKGGSHHEIWEVRIYRRKV